jgi:CheY-like chemotaxis protein
LPESPPPPSDYRLRVLVVEDDADTATTFTFLLRQAGHTVALATDGLAAVSQAGSFAPDVVLLDLRLPGLNGHIVAERLREMAWERRPLIIAITGFAEEWQRLRPTETGVDLCLRKPADPATLLGLLGRWAAGLRNRPAGQ